MGCRGAIGGVLCTLVELEAHAIPPPLSQVLCLSVAVANVAMTKPEITRNASLSINYLVSLLKKNWQNVGALYVKSTMGPVEQIHF